MDRETVFLCAAMSMSHALLLRGGTVVDPSTATNRKADVRVHNGIVAEIGRLDPEPTERLVDVSGLVVAPGLVDVHVHLREPGQEWKETIGSGTAAAAAGGFTTVFCMPNTVPALDSVASLEELERRTAPDALVTVRPVAAITEGRRGQQAVDFEALAKAGAVGFSDDGDTTPNSGIMRQALEASQVLGLPVMVHCEDSGLSGGAMHEGEVSGGLGLQALPATAEEVVIARDIALAAITGGWLHVCHVSTGAGAELIAAAKRRKVRVTGEAMPHHLTMTDEWVAGCRQLAIADGPAQIAAIPANPDTKVNPPLRSRRDTRLLLKALKRGTIEIVATDHAPHGRPEKHGSSFLNAAFGLTGSELALPIMLNLVRAGDISLDDLVGWLSVIPARLWGLNAGSLRPGTRADIVVFDPDEIWRADAEKRVSRGTNTPMIDMALPGRVKMTFVGGDERYRAW